MKPNDTHATQNLYEAAFCLCKGHKLAGKRRDGSKVTIVFAGAGVREDAMRFYNGAKVEAKALTDSYRTLKDYIFER